MLPVPQINDWVDFLLVLGVVIAAFVLWLLSTAMLIWGERRLVSKMQSRIGPNRLGPFGMLQTVADGAKFFFKEDITPRNADKVVYFTAPLVSAIVAMMTFAVIPFGGRGIEIGDRVVSLQVWDPTIGILWTLAMGSIGVYGIVLAGWSSGSKYPLLGGVRSSAQMVSYELAMGLGAAAVFIYTGSLRSSDIVAGQAGSLIPGGSVFGVVIPGLDLIPAFNIVPMFPAFLLFFISAIAETQRPPFDLPEAEGELVAGFHTEYSAAKFAMLFLAEFMNVITMSALVVTMFLGGPSGPVPSGDAWWQIALQLLLPIGYFAGKVMIFIFVFVWLRATLPRMRYDRLMDLGWRVMLPLGIVWVFLTGFAVVVRSYVSTTDDAIGQIAPFGALIFGVLAFLAFVAPVFAGAREDEATVSDEGSGGGGGGTRRPTPPAGPSGGATATPDPDPVATTPADPASSDDESSAPEPVGA